VKRILQAGAHARFGRAGERDNRPRPPARRSTMSVPKATESWFSSSWITANFAVFRFLEESTSEYQMKQTIRPVPRINVFYR